MATIFEKSKEWLQKEGFVYSGYALCFMPPNHIYYKHEDGRRAMLEDEPDGQLTVDGKPWVSNIHTLHFFCGLLTGKMPH